MSGQEHVAPAEAEGAESEGAAESGAVALPLGSGSQRLGAWKFRVLSTRLLGARCRGLALLMEQDSHRLAFAWVAFFGMLVYC